jgi:hypothetical protein
MWINVPVPEEKEAGPQVPAALRGLGVVGVIDNSKPRFDVLVGAALEELTGRGFSHSDDVYIRKPSPTRPAEAGEIDRLAAGTVAVIVGSGD